MEEQNGAQKPESENQRAVMDMSLYKTRFEEAVEDAQYMIIHASTDRRTEIKRETIETLSRARLSVENQQALSAEDEAGFWLAYQDLWKLVEPATAESIKANLPLEKTFTSMLFENVPELSQWFGTGTISKARKTVNGYIVFTVLVLIPLLILQIYWVIGNQLTTQSAELLQKEADLSLQINENEKDLRAIEIRYEQNEKASENFTGTYTYKDSSEWERDTLENSFNKAKLDTDLESLKSQLERSLKVLTAWSDPWNFLISPKEEQPLHSAKYAPLFSSLEEEIGDIQKHLDDDPTGAKAAKSQNDPLYSQRVEIKKQLEANQALITKFDKQKAEIQKLTDEIAGIQEKVDALIAEYNNASDTRKNDIVSEYDNLDKKVTGLDGKEIDLETISADELNVLKDDLNDKLATIETSEKGIQDKITSLQLQDKDLEGRLVSGEKFVSEWEQDKKTKEKDKENLSLQEQADVSRENSRQALLAGLFVLVILQSYLLPLLYGILGASTSILRNLSNQIKEVTYSEEAGIQHLLRIALGALAGIMVGWFTPNGTTSFIGSVSPLAIAFIVGYNIELFFSLMDAVISQVKRLQSSTAPTKENQLSSSQSSANQRDVSSASSKKEQAADAKIAANKSTKRVKSDKKPSSKSTTHTTSTGSKST